MVVKDAAGNECLNLENHRQQHYEHNHHDDHETAPTATDEDVVTTLSSGRRHYCLCSRLTVFLVAVCFLCTLGAVALLVYNFAVCARQEQLAACDRTSLGGANAVYNISSVLVEPPAADDDVAKHVADVRLPRAVRPLAYNISVLPRFGGNFGFEGEVRVVVLVLEDCTNITMHVNELNISKSDVVVRQMHNMRVRKRQAPLSVRAQYILESKQFYVIEFNDKLVRNATYEVRIKFNGIMKDFLQGFYRSSYQVGNETRWLASTQFQPTDARRAFPCFDEPALKAKFTLNIARPRNMSSVSNMPIARTTPHKNLPDYEWDHYKESVPMSTYLVAFAVSDFKHLKNGNFSVWVRENALQSAQYTLDIGPKMLAFFESFFDVPFPLPKMDAMAVPDFQAGAMENWGLIIFREANVLYKQGVSRIIDKQNIALVVGHELAHQWFGNLVTPVWWSDLWLNEGFATYMEYMVLDAIEPDWKIHDQFVVNDLQAVLQEDALAFTHEISVEVQNPEEITEIFDPISYRKGSAIIRMMSYFLTPGVFRQGLSTYLKELSYGSATQDDLWRYLTREARNSGVLSKNTNVKRIMDTWTLQAGYPVVTLTRHRLNNTISLEQTRFVYVPGSAAGSKALWWLPITYTTANELNFENTRPQTWMPATRRFQLEIQQLNASSWFIFNIQQTGFYRVNYDVENWHAITQTLLDPGRFQRIGQVNRAQLIDDSMNLARGNYLSYDVALNLTRYLHQERDLVPWKAALANFNFLTSMFVSQGSFDLLKNYLLKLLDGIYNEVGFRDSADKLLSWKRFYICEIACYLGHSECIAESSRQFQNWLQDPNPDVNNPIAPNLRDIVYCSAIRYGTEAEWDFAFERYVQSTTPAEKEVLMIALACSKEPWILARYLRLAISTPHIRKQDVPRIFISVTGNVVGQQIAFNFLRSNWLEIINYLGNSTAAQNTILAAATRHMNTKFELSELLYFVNTELKATMSRSIKQIIETVKINVDWMNRNYETIVKWLEIEAKATK